MLQRTTIGMSGRMSPMPVRGQAADCLNTWATPPGVEHRSGRSWAEATYAVRWTSASPGRQPTSGVVRCRTPTTWHWGSRSAAVSWWRHERRWRTAQVQGVRLTLVVAVASPYSVSHHVGRSSPPPVGYGCRAPPLCGRADCSTTTPNATGTRRRGRPSSLRRGGGRGRLAPDLALTSRPPGALQRRDSRHDGGERVTDLLSRTDPPAPPAAAPVRSPDGAAAPPGTPVSLSTQPSPASLRGCTRRA